MLLPKWESCREIQIENVATQLNDKLVKRHKRNMPKLNKYQTRVLSEDSDKSLESHDPDAEIEPTDVLIDVITPQKVKNSESKGGQV